MPHRVVPCSDAKAILNNISGEFRAGELSVIIGASGCGKTTLLNLLADYRIRKTEGDINVNETKRDLKTFRQLSRYVFQEDNIIPSFTVLETMMFASKLKVKTNCSKVEREKLIYEILDTFHLRQQSHTLIANLSGGERKRVSIALELIDDPSVLLLDEPTTGLDECSASQCITFLHKLAKDGRTVICSLHCPSARQSQMFDKVYAMSCGECIYQGAVKNLVPYMELFNLQCPVTHNPLDFIIDVSIKSFGDFQNKMVGQIQNGNISLCPADVIPQPTVTIFETLEGSTTMVKRSQSSGKCSWWLEYKIISMRFFQQMWREQVNVKLRIMAHIVCSIIIGLIFYNVSRNAQYSIFNYFLAIAFITSAIFLAMAPMLATVPRDIRYMKSEYFNQWYRLSSYLMAMVTAQLPILGPMSVVFASIIFIVTGQPMQLWRLLLLIGITLLTSLVSLSFGLLIGSAFNGLHGLFIGPLGIGIMLLFTNLASTGGDIPLYQKVLMYGSFMRHILEGVLESFFGFDRSDFPCPNCDWVFAFTKPKYILKLLGCGDISYLRAVIVSSGITILFSLLSFLILKRRLNVKYLSRRR